MPRWNRLIVKGILSPGSVPAPMAVSRILGIYYECYYGTTYGAITSVPMSFNVISLFSSRPAFSAPSVVNRMTDGSFGWDWSGFPSSTDVQTCRARGQKVVLTVGGAGFGFNWDTRAKSQKFIDTIQTVIAGFGTIDGLDFNNFEGDISINSAEIIWIASELRRIYGSSFYISADPQPNSTIQRGLCSAMAAANVLDWATGQYYDWTGFNAVGFISTRAGDWVSAIGATKTVLGMGASYTGGGTLADSVREWSATETLYPTVRGAWGWSHKTNSLASNVWGSTMTALVEPTF